MNVFNPEHEQCLSNGNRNYCPDLSSQKFAQDCASIMRFGGSGEDINVWGWDLVIKHRLLNQGVPEEKLPSDEYLDLIRRLAHRRESVKLGIYLSERLESPYLSFPAQREVRTLEELAEFICGIFDIQPDDSKFINGDLIPMYDENEIRQWLEQEVSE